VPEWVDATEARLDQLADLADEADRLAAAFDLPGYVTAIQTFSVAAEGAGIDQASGDVPDVAGAANDQAVAAFAAMYEAAALYLHYYTAEMTPQVFARAAAAYQEAQRKADAARREASRVSAECEVS
jgi:hypothetical protein